MKVKNLKLNLDQPHGYLMVKEMSIFKNDIEDNDIEIVNYWAWDMQSIKEFKEDLVESLEPLIIRRSDEVLEDGTVFQSKWMFKIVDVRTYMDIMSLSTSEHFVGREHELTRLLTLIWNNNNFWNVRREMKSN